MKHSVNDERMTVSAEKTQNDAKAETFRRIEEGCVDCGECRESCLFLERHGPPGEILTGWRNGGSPASAKDPEGEAADAHGKGPVPIPYLCSLCGLCERRCPEDLPIPQMFLWMRRELVRKGLGPLPAHRGLLSYQNTGASSLFTLYRIPPECETVFWPGCALPGARPGRVLDLYSTLGKQISALGLVLDCCFKPSHDLGQEEVFEREFAPRLEKLKGLGVREVLVGCPSCFRVFADYGDGIGVRTIYEVLASSLPEAGGSRGETLTLHDPCPIRDEEAIHGSARTILEKKGYTVEETETSRTMALCCGEGGAVSAVDPELGRRWAERRTAEAADRPIVTYCAGCYGILYRETPVHMLADLFFHDGGATPEPVRPPGSLGRWANRLVLKIRAKFMKAPVAAKPQAISSQPSAVSSPSLRPIDVSMQGSKAAETPASEAASPGDPGRDGAAQGGSAGEMPPGKGGKRGAALKAAGLVAFIAAALAAVHLTGLIEYLDEEKLRAWIEACGAWGPAIYMGIYVIAPALFLPGLPITVAGGLLFGPFWGVVYTITSATAGACVAFLIARYLGRDWVAGKMGRGRLGRLDAAVERQGWKIVAFTRLIPIFPFNLLNYAFGLTRIKFAHYALASFLFMLPACAAYVVFSASLIDLVKGRISPQMIVGIALVVAVSLVPLLMRSRRARWGAASGLLDEDK